MRVKVLGAVTRRELDELLELPADRRPHSLSDTGPRQLHAVRVTRIPC
jgi:hypothetical protein